MGIKTGEGDVWTRGWCLHTWRMSAWWSLLDGGGGHCLHSAGLHPHGLCLQVILIKFWNDWFPLNVLLYKIYRSTKSSKTRFRRQDGDKFICVPWNSSKSLQKVSKLMPKLSPSKGLKVRYGFIIKSLTLNRSTKKI